MSTISTAAESAAPYQRSYHAALRRRCWQDASDGGNLDVVAPASEEHLATVAAATEDYVDAAAAAARAQFDGGRGRV